MDELPNRRTSLALLALGTFSGLACLLAIGAATALVVMAMDSEPEDLARHDRDCAVVAWRSGETLCFRGAFAVTDKSERGDLAVVAQSASAR